MRALMQQVVRLVVPLVVALMLAPFAAHAQRIAGPQPEAPIIANVSVRSAPEPPADHAAAIRRASPRRLVIGAVLGAVAGVLTCNLISELTEEVEESTHCTTKGNLYFGIGGAALGALVAALTD